MPPSRYASVLLSSSVAAIGAPMLESFSVFSSIDRAVRSPSVNTGVLLTGVSSRFVTLIVTVIVTVKLPSETVIVTE